MNRPPVVLLAAAHDHPLVGALGDAFKVTHIPTGALICEQAAQHEPDVVILDENLPDMTGFQACQNLLADRLIGFNVPCLVSTSARPTPEQRVTAVRSGVWDFVRDSAVEKDLVLRLLGFVQAKRNLDIALADGLSDPRTGLHTRNGLARRARQLGALMAREHGGLACIVFTLDGDAHDPEIGGLIAKAARVSDVVGALTDHEIAVLAPGTDQEGVFRLAKRMASLLHEGNGHSVTVLRAGYDAVANLSYTPVDPIELIQRAMAALHGGEPQHGLPWLRRYQVALANQVG